MKITRDDILALPRNARGFILETDGGAILDVIHAGEDGIGYALSSRTGLVVRYHQTGRTVRSNMVRVRVQFPRDTEDVAGTLEFTDNYATGGRINSSIAAKTGPMAISGGRV